jgi:hypothetical protein
MRGKGSGESESRQDESSEESTKVYNSLDRGKCLDPKGCRLPLVTNTKKAQRRNLARRNQL